MFKPRLLVVSHVLPFPLSAGQHRRVRYTLDALRESFHVTFAVPVPPEGISAACRELKPLVDEMLVLPSQYSRSGLSKARYITGSVVHMLTTGLKRSNYRISEVEFTPERLASLVEGRDFDLVLFEYWHAAANGHVFKEKGIPVVVDIHNVLWKNYAFQLDAPANLPSDFAPALPASWRSWAVDQYRKQEAEAWKSADGIVVMNASEREQVREVVGAQTPMFYAPMGTDLSGWPYLWEPEQPARVAYYGGLSNPYNVKDAFTCYEQLMPEIWKRMPETELWLVGSKPTDAIKAMAEADKRVKVTGFVDRVQEVLKTMTLKVMPWSEAHGFRSRLIEVMALGVPVVTTEGVVGEMDMDNGKGIIVEPNNDTLAEACLSLLENSERAREQSRMAREQAELKFGFDATYGQLARDLRAFVQERQAQPA